MRKRRGESIAQVPSEAPPPVRPYVTRLNLALQDPTGRAAAVVLCSGYQLAGESDRARHVAEEIVEGDPTFELSAYAESQPYRDAATIDHALQSLRDAGLPD